MFLSSSLLLFSVFLKKFLSLRRMMKPPAMLMDEWCAGVYAQKTGRFPNTPLSDNHPGAPFSPSPSCASLLSALESGNSGSNSLLRESSWDSLPEDRSGSGSDSDSATIDLTGTRFPSIPGATTVRGPGASLVSRPLSPCAPETKRRKSGSGGRTGSRIVARPKQPVEELLPANREGAAKEQTRLENRGKRAAKADADRATREEAFLLPETPKQKVCWFLTLCWFLTHTGF